MRKLLLGLLIGSVALPAAAQSVRAKLAVPHHFGTFPGIAATAG